MQLIIRHEMKEKLETEMLHQVTINKNDLVWVKPNAEIILHGKMFDVKSIKAENDLLHIEGLFDDEETAIEKFIESTGNTENSNQKNTLISFFQVFQGMIESSVLSEAFVYSNSGNYLSLLPNSTIIDRPAKVTIPPPRS
jgi:hypothetical protein